MPGFTALNMTVEHSTPSSTLTNSISPPEAAEPRRHESPLSSLSSSTEDFPPEFCYNTFSTNAFRQNKKTGEETEEARCQPDATYSGPAPDCQSAVKNRPVSIEELLIPQHCTQFEQRIFPIDRQSDRVDSASSMHVGLQSGARKRKRRFSARTKTGCFTCRKRKKKCDEAKPTCNNCERGNYRCTGYPAPSIRENTTTMEPLRDETSNGNFRSTQSDMFHPVTRSIATSPRVVAQMALSHVATERNSHLNALPTASRRSTEKEKMLTGSGFCHFDQELSLERDRAAMSCRLFNTIVRTGVSIEEHTRRFLDTIRFGELASKPQQPARGQLDSAPSQVAIEAPFHCDYGYNIMFGQNILIRRNCAFNDAGRIHVGDNSIIGPSVSIFTEEISTDPRYRRTFQGIQFGRGVIIDSDCWIGGNVTILPGMIIGKGAAVMAGSVVAEDVPPFVVAAGNPARVIHSVVPL